MRGLAVHRVVTDGCAEELNHKRKGITSHTISWQVAQLKSMCRNRCMNIYTQMKGYSPFLSEAYAPPWVQIKCTLSSVACGRDIAWEIWFYRVKAGSSSIRHDLFKAQPKMQGHPTAQRNVKLKLPLYNWSLASFLYPSKQVFIPVKILSFCKAMLTLG